MDKESANLREQERANFEHLLDWLDPDRERAGWKYEQIRSRLIRIFHARGCGDPESLADETIERVTGKIDDLVKNHQGDPANRFVGFAKKVFLEYTKVHKPAELPENLTKNNPPTEELEDHDRCLRRCLSKLDREAESREPASVLKPSEFILEYYRHDKSAKLETRRKLMDILEIPSHGALRIRAYRIRKTLQECVFGCLEGLAK